MPVVKNVQIVLGFVLMLFLASPSWAAEYQVEPLDEGPPTDQLSDEIAAELAPKGLRVSEGDSPYCDFWLQKEWEVKPDFEPTASVLYPFREGQLIGVLRFLEKGSDFRDQDLDKGVYTLRYSLQPVDGSHIGTSPTRDFFALVRAEDDKSLDPIEYDKLTELSAEAAQSAHPAILSLQPVMSPEGEFPSTRHFEGFDWWIVGFKGKAKADDKTEELPVEFVVAGEAIE